MSLYMKNNSSQALAVYDMMIKIYRNEHGMPNGYVVTERDISMLPFLLNLGG